MRKNLFFLLFLTLTLVACKAPMQVAYFQDVKDCDTLLTSIQARPITVQAGDKLLIVVNSSNPQLASLFNLPIVGTRIGMNNGSYNTSQATMPYTVASDGTIDFPELGLISVGGMTRDQIARTIKTKLVEGDLCKDAVVSVDLDNMYINVLGEVNKPGRYNITKDVMTLMDALGLAGDLNIQGQRRNVTVVRQTPQGNQIYNVDLTNMKKVVESPAYYLQQNDVVYVEPNDFRKRQTTVNANNALSTSFWISVASLLTSIAVLIIR